MSALIDINYNQSIINDSLPFPESLTSSRSRVTASMSLYVLVIWPTRSAHKTARNKNDHVTTDATSLPNKVWPGSALLGLIPEKSPKLCGVRGQGSTNHCKVLTLHMCVCVHVCVHIRTCTLGGVAEGKALEWKGVWPHIRSSNQSGSAAQWVIYKPPERALGSRPHFLYRPSGSFPKQFLVLIIKQS